jgi:hypothetical protein
MKTLTHLLLISAILILSSCKKENTTTDIFTIDSEFSNNTFKGFVFEDLSIVEYSFSDSTDLDFFVLAQTNDTGLVLGPYLSNTDMGMAFQLTASFNTGEDAQAFFNSYTTAVDTTYLMHALNIQPHQVWTVLTLNGSKGKILILEKEGYEVNNTPFAKIVFKAGLVD